MRVERFTVPAIAKQLTTTKGQQRIHTLPVTNWSYDGAAGTQYIAAKARYWAKCSDGVQTGEVLLGWNAGNAFVQILWSTADLGLTITGAINSDFDFDIFASNTNVDSQPADFYVDLGVEYLLG